VGEQADDVALVELLRDPASGVDHGARGDPGEDPLLLRELLVTRSESEELTRNFRSSTDSSKIGGMNPSSSDRSPYTSSPSSGSAATTLTSGLCSCSRRPTPVSVPPVPSPATKWVTSGRSRTISAPVPS